MDRFHNLKLLATCLFQPSTILFCLIVLPKKNLFNNFFTSASIQSLYISGSPLSPCGMRFHQIYSSSPCLEWFGDIFLVMAEICF